MENNLQIIECDLMWANLEITLAKAIFLSKSFSMRGPQGAVPVGLANSCYVINPALGVSIINVIIIISIYI